MAALSDASVPTLLDLRHVSPEQLDGLLAEETELWKSSLDWDFRPSADLVRRFVGMHSLSGFALAYGDTLAGYAYYVTEESKGLVGDLFVRRPYRTMDAENRLLKKCVEAMNDPARLRRVESQLMLLPAPLSRPVPFSDRLSVYPREFMEIEARQIAALPRADTPPGTSIMPWGSGRQERAANVIAAAYSGHVDSEINDQYRSLGGARRFLLNIVQYPGCGAFFPSGSFVAHLPGSQELAGISLASLVGPDVGHITQICVTPVSRGRGLGYELLRHSMEGLRLHGCRKVSLTVTAANEEAVKLYEKCGFKVRRTFAAYVWERTR
jgi:ribosomal protein S18 acetylase RimI-like enzyme